ncbi:LuxR C-terminal-related transcriptional regulator [Brasilonema sp. UFV-L1]|uniref:helix-turn-helix transcriptional regulator n=1 Tax=Brasilonema sp. UFV-L1 TaxID=2234130 RepID=UPI00145F5EC3|nr:LuxR C-terminal-related transcriptional regulator [Brasilonema sp. UFV-L1]NMG07951.1 helix-turn-helix transcriptional regulator [Brasilonema sp. UFV-L1]
MITTKISTTSGETRVQQKINDIELHDSQRGDLFQEVIEELQNGLFLLNETGELIHANTSAFRIFSQINQDSSNSDFLPPVIWCFCKSILENPSISSNKTIILSHEIRVNRSKVFCVCAKWLNFEKLHRSYLLVIIENKYEFLKNIALAEVKKYDLTPRETEIWCLYREKFSYKEIATQLYITVNTVKKHMRNIHAKRQAFLNCEI